jgi:hypothetical protein
MGVCAQLNIRSEILAAESAGTGESQYLIRTEFIPMMREGRDAALEIGLPAGGNLGVFRLHVEEEGVCANPHSRLDR